MRLVLMTNTQKLSAPGLSNRHGTIRLAISKGQPHWTIRLWRNSGSLDRPEDRPTRPGSAPLDVPPGRAIAPASVDAVG